MFDKYFDCLSVYIVEKTKQKSFLNPNKTVDEE